MRQRGYAIAFALVLLALVAAAVFAGRFVVQRFRQDFQLRQEWTPPVISTSPAPDATLETATAMGRPTRTQVVIPTPVAPSPEPFIPAATPGPAPTETAPGATVPVDTPTRGAEVTKGSAVAETGARGQGFGLSTGGGAGSGSYLDVANFCCPDYLVTMVGLIRSNWNPVAEVAGETVIKFTILRNGTIGDVALEKSSGYTALDLTAQRAVYMTRQLPALPAAFSNETLTVHLNFQYQR